MPPKHDDTSTKGKPGGGGDDGGGGGGGGTPNAIHGTPGSETLRGTRKDDIFYAYGGEDTIQGRDGTDVLVVDGSVWDYEWKIWGGAWELWDRNDRSSDKTLYDVEIIRFNDYEVTLGEEIPLEILQAPPDELRVMAGGEGSFTYELRDYDDFISVEIVTDEDLAYGSMWNWSVIEGGTYGANGQQRTFEFNYDYDRYYNDYTDGPVEELAEGEEYILPVTLRIKTSNFWLDADEPDRAEYTDITFDLVIVGRNEAPTIQGTGAVEAVEDGGEVRFDLSQFGFDIDSDDDGSTLTYQVVSETGGLDVRIEGAELVLTASSLIDTTTSDEFATGRIELRAVDRHGAPSEETITIDLTVTGIDDTAAPPDYLTAAGGIDTGALGIAGVPVDDFGTSVVNGWTAPVETIADLVSFTDGDDVTVIEAGLLMNFDEGGLIRDGVEVLENTAFVMGDGDDTFVFTGQNATQSWFAFNDVFGGAGEDVVAVSVTSAGEAMFHGGTIDTGAQSDRVLMHIEYGVKGWWTGDIVTGSGHDFVDLQLTADGVQTGLGEVLMTGGVDLGTGDDRLNITATSGQLNTLQKVDFSVGAGAGDDHVTIDLSGLGTAYTVPAEQDPTGLFAELYPGGFDGGVHMGDGADVLELTLSDPRGAATASLNGGDGFDTLYLHHLSGGDALIEDLGGSVRITDGDQVLNISGFEEIFLGDGTDVFAFA